MTIEEFWDECYMTPSNNSSDTLLVFKGQIIDSGRGMSMKMKQEALLKDLIEKGEVIV